MMKAQWKTVQVSLSAGCTAAHGQCCLTGSCNLVWLAGKTVDGIICVRRAMQDEYNALELELKHHEKEFADLVSEELEARFLRFEEVTLAAVQKLVGIISAPAHGPTGARLHMRLCIPRHFIPWNVLC